MSNVLNIHIIVDSDITESDVVHDRPQNTAHYSFVGAESDIVHSCGRVYFGIKISRNRILHFFCYICHLVTETRADTEGEVFTDLVAEQGGRRVNTKEAFDAVNAEFQKGFDGRWGAGLPGSGDMQMLFLQSAVDKMDENYGRAAIIENGSPLFNGGTASGESQIRRWLLESDLIEAIIALPTELFYNTEIATYIWVLSKNKRAARKGKVQLIDATNIYHKLRKALGKKKNEVTPDDRAEITRIYAEFQEGDCCKIFRNEEFMYREYVVMQPLQRSYGITEERIQRMLSSGALSNLYDEGKVAKLENSEELSGKDEKKLESLLAGKPVFDSIVETLTGAITETVYSSPASFIPILTKILSGVTGDKKLIERIADGLSVMDKTAEIQRDRKGNIIYDKETKVALHR